MKPKSSIRINSIFLSLKIEYLPLNRFCFSVTAFICFLLCSAGISAQYRFDSFTTDNGLPQNGVRAIAQTPDGYLWFTTFDGLVRYDGVRFTVFDKNNSPGISNNRFSLLHAEPDGTLFAGTEDGGLTVYRDGKFQSFNAANSLLSGFVQQFRPNIRGEYYIATEAGNYYFRDDKFVPVPEQDTPNQERFYSTPAGNLWLYDENEIRQITSDKGEFVYPLKTNFYHKGFNRLKILEDHSGSLWLGDLDGLYRLKNGEITKFGVPDGIPQRAIFQPYIEDDDGSIWFASDLPWLKGIGIVRYKDGKFTVLDEDAGLSSLFVGQLFRDREGTLWAASDRGLNHLQKQFIRSFSVRDGLVNQEVYPILQTRNGDVYIGTMHGLSVFRGGKFTEIDVKKPDGAKISVTSLYEDESGRLWVGAIGDLFRLENGKLKSVSEPYKITVWAIQADSRGNVWVSSDNHGVFEFRDDKLIANYTTADGLPSNDVKVIHEDKTGALWFGTYGGLARLENDKFISFTTADGLASNRVRTIYEDGEETLWIGTYDGGLSRFKDGKFFNFTVENGLFNNGVFQILEDEKKNFWISSNRGIFRINRRELEDAANGKISKINSVAYGKQDGMLNTECNGGRQPAGIKTADGNFWFPTQDGVVVLNPNEVSLNLRPPPVQIESVLIERQAINFQDGIALKANEENLEIRYTGISFIKSEQVKFRYKIEGLDTNWTDVGTIRDVYFPSLPAGEYTFHVIAANSDGVWNEEGARLKIRVNAPLWRKTWFIILFSIVIVAIIFLIFRFRERELKRRQMIQQEFARRLIESQEQERKRIASELHDSLGQYLLAVKNWALFGLNSVTKENPAREYLDEVSETTSLALEEIRQMTHNLRPYQLERLGLTNTLEYMLKNIKSSSPIVFSCDIKNVDGVLSEDAEIVFYRIVQEAVNNIIKHSEAANAQISIKPDEAGLEFICRDNGKGFDIETAKNSPASGLGLNGIAERVKILKGECEINSEIGKFTIISVKIPRNK